MIDQTPENVSQGTQSARNTQTIAQPSGLQGLWDREWLEAFGHHLWKHFREDRSFEAAAALAYTSLLALVPLMAVTLAVISAFPVFGEWREDLQDFIFLNFVPTAGDAVQEYLTTFVERTAGLTAAGTLFLLVTALLLMNTIERTLNRIWRVTTLRGVSGRLAVYWAVLTLGPMLMGASLALTSYLAAVPVFAPEAVRGVLHTVVLALTPFGVALVAFTLTFMIVPNRRVDWRHALIGALLSALLFELAKRGFVYYVTNFPTYERLYGALATIPLFLVWMYTSWVVILLGATISAALTTFRYRRAPWRWSERHDLQLLMRLMGHFREAQRRGEKLTSSMLLSREPAATDAQLQRLLGNLQCVRLVQQDENADWFLSADLDEVTLDDLYRSAGYVLPITEIDDLPNENDWDHALIEALKEMREGAKAVMTRPVKSFLKSSEQ